MEESQEGMMKLAIEAHAYYQSTQEAEAGESLLVQG